MNRYPVGQKVVCIKDLKGIHPETVQCVGEIDVVVDGLTAFIFRSDYVVFFPALKDQPCSNCGKLHGGRYPMAHQELKPLDDPDQGQHEEEQHDLEEPVFGFAAVD